MAVERKMTQNPNFRLNLVCWRNLFSSHRSFDTYGQSAVLVLLYLGAAFDTVGLIVHCISLSSVRCLQTRARETSAATMVRTRRRMKPNRLVCVNAFITKYPA